MNNYIEAKDLIEINKELKVIINYSIDGLYVTDGEGNTLLINPAYKEMTGLTEDDVIGKNVRDLVDKGVFEKSSTLMSIEQRKKVSSLQTIRGNKLLTTSNPIFDESGKIYRIVSSVRNVTELYQTQEDLYIAKKLTEQYQNEIIELKKQLEFCQNLGADYIMKSRKMLDVINKIQKTEKLKVNILITGETGVGKDVVANMIHNLRGLPKEKLISVNCNAIPDNLFEAEFFGYEAGSFTGARASGKKGLFELADKGTMFLDEIGDLPRFMQGKLLRVLQEKEFIRVGGDKRILCDVQIIAATNRDLKKMIEQGSFREDLYYRLNVYPIHIPPLRERREDIWDLTQLFLNEYNHKYGIKKHLSINVFDYLMNYSWPGNVRELRSVIEQMVLFTEGEDITVNSIPKDLDDVMEDIVIKVNSVIPLKKANSLLEDVLISKALEESGSIRKAAEKLEVHYSTIAKKLKMNRKE